MTCTHEGAFALLDHIIEMSESGVPVNVALLVSLREWLECCAESEVECRSYSLVIEPVFHHIGPIPGFRREE